MNDRENFIRWLNTRIDDIDNSVCPDNNNNIPIHFNKAHELYDKVINTIQNENLMLNESAKEHLFIRFAYFLYANSKNK